MIFKSWSDVVNSFDTICISKSRQKQPSCKKRCGPVQNGQYKKKLWNPSWRQRNGCDGRLMVQILIVIIQVNLCCLLPASLGLGTKLTWIIAIKFVPWTYHQSHFLAASLDFTTFFILAILNRAALFFTAWLFLSRYSHSDEIHLSEIWIIWSINWKGKRRL